MLLQLGDETQEWQDQSSGGDGIVSMPSVGTLLQLGVGPAGAQQRCAEEGKLQAATWCAWHSSVAKQPILHPGI
jgi:hypothetical protein